MRATLFLGFVVVSCAARVPPPPSAAAPLAAEPAPVTLPPGVKRAPLLPAETQPWAFAPGANVDVRVDLTKDVAEVTPRHFGNNVAWYDAKEWLRSAPVVERAAKSGTHFWRWPGGSSANDYHWDGNYGAHTKDQMGRDVANMNAPWAAGTDDYIAFCRATGAEGIVTVNYAAARYGNVEKAADLAARWVRYFNVEKRFKVRYWEIGNEVYGPWEAGNKVAGKAQLSGDAYAKDFNVFARAMREVDPDILIGAPAVDVDSGDEWLGYRWWMRDMLPVLADSADFLVLHNYFLWPFERDKFVNPTNDKLFDNVQKVGKAKSDVDAMVKTYTRRGSPFPVMMTEFNVVNASAPQTIQLINGLFTAEIIGEAVKTGYAGSNIWDWKNGLDAKLGGDHGMLASGDRAVPDATPRPTYYAYVIYERAFGQHMVEASSSNPRVKVYASRFAGGEAGLVFVNEQNEPITVNVDLGARKGKGTAIAWVLDGADLNARQVRWNGVAGPPGGGGPFPIERIAPYILSYDPATPVRLHLPANSASGVVVY